MGIGRHILVGEADFIFLNQFIDPVRIRFAGKAFHGIVHGHADRTANGIFGNASITFRVKEKLEAHDDSLFRVGQSVVEVEYIRLIHGLHLRVDAEPFFVEFRIRSVGFKVSQGLVDLFEEVCFIFSDSHGDTGIGFFGVADDFKIFVPAFFQVVESDRRVDDDGIAGVALQFHPALAVGVVLFDRCAGFRSEVYAFGADLSADRPAFEVIKAMNGVVILADDDGIAVLEVRFCKGNLFLSFRCSIHAGCDHVNLAAAQGRNKGIEAEAFDFNLHTRLFADGIG